MKIFFPTFLYLNVGLIALFFSMWLWTALPKGAMAEERSEARPQQGQPGSPSTTQTAPQKARQTQPADTQAPANQNKTALAPDSAQPGPQATANNNNQAGPAQPADTQAPANQNKTVVAPDSAQPAGQKATANQDKVVVAPDSAQPAGQKATANQDKVVVAPDSAQPGQKATANNNQTGPAQPADTQAPANQDKAVVAPDSAQPGQKATADNNQVGPALPGPKATANNNQTGPARPADTQAPANQDKAVVAPDSAQPGQKATANNNQADVVDSDPANTAGHKEAQVSPSPAEGVPAGEGNRGLASDNLPVPSPPAVSGNSNKLNKALKSVTEPGKQPGSSATVSNELTDVNQRVLEIHKMLSDYQYDSSDRRDPFIPFRPKGEEVERLEVLNHATSGYDLNEIKLVGMKWNSGLGRSKAMFRTPDNELHYLQVNDRIGSKGAVIYRLGGDEVVVLEPRFMVGSSSGTEKAYEPIIMRLDRYKSTPNKKKSELGRKASPTTTKEKRKPASASHNNTLSSPQEQALTGYRPADIKGIKQKVTQMAKKAHQ